MILGKVKGRLRDDGQGGANVHKKVRQKLSRFEARTRWSRLCVPKKGPLGGENEVGHREAGREGVEEDPRKERKRNARRPKEAPALIPAIIEIRDRHVPTGRRGSSSSSAPVR